MSRIWTWDDWIAELASDELRRTAHVVRERLDAALAPGSDHDIADRISHAFYETGLSDDTGIGTFPHGLAADCHARPGWVITRGPVSRLFYDWRFVRGGDRWAIVDQYDEIPALSSMARDVGPEAWHAEPVVWLTRGELAEWLTREYFAWE